MKKTPISNSDRVSVLFEMPAEIHAKRLNVVGDFNAWDHDAAPMKQRKDSSWYRAIRLAPGTYRFRYLADGTTWHNDWAADEYEPSGMGEDNSVVVVSRG